MEHYPSTRNNVRIQEALTSEEKQFLNGYVNGLESKLQDTTTKLQVKSKLLNRVSLYDVFSELTSNLYANTDMTMIFLGLLAVLMIYANGNTISSISTSVQKLSNNLSLYHHQTTEKLNNLTEMVNGTTNVISKSKWSYLTDI